MYRAHSIASVLLFDPDGAVVLKVGAVSRHRNAAVLAVATRRFSLYAQVHGTLVTGFVITMNFTASPYLSVALVGHHPLHFHCHIVLLIVAILLIHH